MRADVFDYHRRVGTSTRMSYNAIQDNLDMERILKVNYYKVGVVLDLDCARSSIIFEQVTVNEK